MSDVTPVQAWQRMTPERRLDVLEALDAIGNDCEALVAGWPPPELRDDIETAKRALEHLARLGAE